MSFTFRYLFVVTCIVGILLVACQPSQETPQAALTRVLDTTATALDSPLPVPTATLLAVDSPLPAPTRGPSAKGRAAVRGVLLLTRPETIAPQDDGVYLVQIDTGAGMVFPAVDPKTSLQAEVDEVNGQFFISDVEAGLYALVALTIQGTQFSIRSVDTGDPVTVLVDEKNLDQVIDLGQLTLP